MSCFERSYFYYNVFSKCVFSLILLVNASAPAEDLVSELTFKYDVLHLIIIFDETHHGKGLEGDLGGSRTTSLTNPHLP